MSCPCCSNQLNDSLVYPSPHHYCQTCGHRWCDSEVIPFIDYCQQRNRNIIMNAAHRRKLCDRMPDISRLLRPGMHVLEIGCAEGSLGAMVRASMAVQYTGVELSADAAAAALVLSRVLKTPTAEIVGETFDVLLSFHVLEHILDIAGELVHWRRLIAESGRLLLEVPNQSGHRLVNSDPNFEHLHQFTPASLTLVLQHAGFEVERLETGHWESSVYSDSLRIVARPILDNVRRRELLLQRFKALLPKPFVAWGIGGDFRGYVEPLLDSLPIAALIDSASHRHGERHGIFSIERYDSVRHGAFPILVCSVRYCAEILDDLATLGIHSSRVVTLDDIFGSTEP